MYITLASYQTEIRHRGVDSSNLETEEFLIVFSVLSATPWFTRISHGVITFDRAGPTCFRPFLLSASVSICRTRSRVSP